MPAVWVHGNSQVCVGEVQAGEPVSLDQKVSEQANALHLEMSVCDEGIQCSEVNNRAEVAQFLSNKEDGTRETWIRAGWLYPPLTCEVANSLWSS